MLFDAIQQPDLFASLSKNNTAMRTTVWQQWQLLKQASAQRLIHSRPAEHTQTSEHHGTPDTRKHIHHGTPW